jgi:hypothetical protein
MGGIEDFTRGPNRDLKYSCQQASILMPTDLTAYHRERRAALEQLNRSKLDIGGPKKMRTSRILRIAGMILMGMAAALGGALGSYF